MIRLPNKGKISERFKKISKGRNRLESSDIPLVKWNGNDCKPLTVEEYLGPQLHPDPSYRKIVENTHSFVDLLNPRLDLGKNTIGLQDLTSIGKFFEVNCMNTEARSTKSLQSICQKVHHAIARSCPEDLYSPWIIQWFVQDNSSEIFNSLSKQVKNYASKFNSDSEYSKSWLLTLNEHLRDLTCSEGLFFLTPNLIDNRWRSRKRSVRLCIWRKATPQRDTDENMIDRICQQLINSLAQAEIQLIPCGASELYQWLTQWFVPKPEKYTGVVSTTELLRAFPWNPSDLERSESLFSNTAKADISRASLHGTTPWTWKKPGIWWFRGQPTRFVTVDELVEEPKIGHLTGELQFWRYSRHNVGPNA